MAVGKSSNASPANTSPAGKSAKPQVPSQAAVSVAPSGPAPLSIEELARRCADLAIHQHGEVVALVRSISRTTLDNSFSIQQSLSGQIDRVRAQVDDVRKALGSFCEFLNAERSELVEELNGLRKDELEHAYTSPLIQVLARVLNRLTQEGGRCIDHSLSGKKPSGVEQDLIDLIHAVAVDIEAELSHLGVARFSAAVGSQFDPARHEAARQIVVSTADVKQQGGVAALEADGFERSGRVIVKSRVVLFRVLDQVNKPIEIRGTYDH